MADEVKIKEVTEKPETAKTAPETAKTASAGKLTLGIEELQALIAASVSQAVQKSSEVIAHAMLEARKPYIPPGQEENDRRMREQTKEIHQRIQLQIEADQATCQHLQGSNSLSEFQGQLGSFVLHRLDTGVVVGICTNCQKKIWSNNPADASFFSKKMANRMSQAGQRVFLDPVKAMNAR